MSDGPKLTVVEGGGGLDAVRKAFDNSKKHEGKKSGGRPPPPPPTEPPDDGSDDDGLFPLTLPWDSPVKALGVNGRVYYFLSAKGQFHQLMDKDINMNPILGLFGGDSSYLRRYWPKYARGSKRMIVENFDHGMLREVLIRSCNQAGIWSPEQGVRGVGSWAEEGNLLVMHCGDMLYMSNGEREIPGLRGRLLYPGAPKLPHPETGAAGVDGPCHVLLKKIETWNWARPDLDAILYVGWIMGGILGAAPPWRAVVWLTGPSGCGKSTLTRLTRWIFGKGGIIETEDATPAGIRQKLADSCITVSVDELESEAENNRARDVMKLARLASSGAESLRGSPGGISMGSVLRSAFQFSSIAMSSLPEQDMNRLFVGELRPVEWAGREKLEAKRPYEPGADYEQDEEEDDDAEDSILGKREFWAKIGRQLRGRALAQFPRYRKTLKSYWRALEAGGHKSRGCDQFGALLAAFDIAMYDEFDGQRVLELAKLLPAKNMAETSGYRSGHESCLFFLLGSQIESWSKGTKETISSLMHSAQREIAEKSNDRQSAKVLEQHGIKIYRDKRDKDGAAWLVAIANNHPGLMKIFAHTDWKGIPGAPGAWSRMMERINGAQTRGSGGKPLRLNFAKCLYYCTALPWEAIFPPIEAGDDEDELVREEDRNL